MPKRSIPGGELSESARDVLECIQRRYRERGVPPSFREIQKELGYRAVGAVQKHVKNLRERGLLESVPLAGSAAAKTASLLPAGAKFEVPKRIPVYGQVAAGSPTSAEQIELGSVFVPEGATKRPCFALRVRGDSMIDVGIFEGDHLIVEKTSQVGDGDIIVALLDGETTVKTYVANRQGTFLRPENKRLKPISIEGRDFTIQGRVISLQRDLLRKP